MPSKLFFTPEVAHMVATQLGLPFRGFTPEDLAEGMGVELEHGTAGGRLTDVTHDDVYATAKIAAAHLYERPDYYVLLRALEAAPRPNPAGMRVVTIDHTSPNYHIPHVYVWIIEHPAEAPEPDQFAMGWILSVSTHMVPPSIERGGSIEPEILYVAFERARFRWTTELGKKRGRRGHWSGPQFLGANDRAARFHAMSDDPLRLEGEWERLPFSEAGMFEIEYRRVVPLLVAAVAAGGAEQRRVAG